MNEIGRFDEVSILYTEDLIFSDVDPPPEGHTPDGYIIDCIKYEDPEKRDYNATTEHMRIRDYDLVAAVSRLLPTLAAGEKLSKRDMWVR